MTDVRVERLASCYDEEDSAEHDKPRPAVMQKELHAVPRIHSRENPRHADDLIDAQESKRKKPEQRDRSEHSTDLCCPAGLKPEETDENHDGDRHQAKRAEGFHTGAWRVPLVVRPTTSRPTRYEGLVKAGIVPQSRDQGDPQRVVPPHRTSSISGLLLTTERNARVL